MRVFLSIVSTKLRQTLTKVTPTIAIAIDPMAQLMCQPNDCGVVSAGYAVPYQNKDCHYATTSDWLELMNKKQHRDTWGGAFVSFSWNKENWECINDVMGHRDCFFTKNDGFVYLSTRLDWLVQCVSSPKINHEAMACQWLFKSSFTDQSCITNVKRLSQLGTVKGFRTDFTSETGYWFPDLRNSVSFKEFNEIVTQIATFPLRHNENFSLGFTGGIDSRVLASFYLRHTDSLQTHYWGHQTDTDFILAQEICKKHAMSQCFFPFEETSWNDFWLQFQQYTLITQVTRPGHAFNHANNLSSFHERGYSIVDGGLCEIISRRKFIKQAYLYKFKRIKHTDTAMIDSFRTRPLVGFASEIKTSWVNNYHKHYLEYVARLPHPKDISIHNWLDFVYLNLFFSQVNSAEQMYQDMHVKSLHPFDSSRCTPLPYFTCHTMCG